MYTTLKNSELYEQAKPTERRLGSRMMQCQLGETAIKEGDLAKALKWFTLAALPRQHDNGSIPSLEQRFAAEEKVRDVKAKLAEIENPTSSSALTPNAYGGS